MRLQKEKKEAVEGDMTPMIDIVFQLIAFFMVLVNFEKVDSDERVVLPTSTLAKPPEEKLKKPIMLQMTADGKIIFLGSIMDVESDEFNSHLFRERRSAGDLLKEVAVIIRAHQAAPMGKVQALITLCQEQGFRRFQLRAKEDQS